MSNENIQTKIDLLEDQIENLERSGFYTEAEIDRATISLRMEMQLYKFHLEINNLAESTAKSKIALESFNEKKLYGMTPKEYEEAIKYHNECFDQMKHFQIQNIQVKQAEILSPKAL